TRAATPRPSSVNTIRPADPTAGCASAPASRTDAITATHAGAKPPTSALTAMASKYAAYDALPSVNPVTCFAVATTATRSSANRCAWRNSCSCGVDGDSKRSIEAPTARQEGEADQRLRRSARCGWMFMDVGQQRRALAPAIEDTPPGRPKKYCG